MSNDPSSRLGRDTSQLDEKGPDSEGRKFKDWFQEYMGVDGNSLRKESESIQAVISDELDQDFIEQRIQEGAPKSLTTERFCAECKSLFDNWPTIGGSSTREHDSKPEPGGWEHAVARSCTTFELEGSTRSGCRFCAFLLQSLKDNKMLETFRKLESRLYHLNENAMSSLSIQNWGGNPIQILWVNFPGKVCTHCNSGIAGELKFNSAFLPDTADCYDEPYDVLDIASKWLSTCSESHELCKINDEGPLPTRLVSIARNKPQLILTSELSKKPRYATLSHSWGSHEVVKLTSESLDSFLEALPIDNLPKTFKEAFEITRTLGLDYIWIDSLCILQDNEDDWQKESSLMSSVYGGSTITIAASSARDSTQGLFLKQPYFSGGLRARTTDGGRHRVQDFRNPDTYKLSTFDTHLGTRAWALQEKMLPPRTIHFSDRGAFWECRTMIASEYLPDGFPKSLVSPLVKRKGKFEWLWRQIVMLYSAANLTFGKDKLPALSGVAKMGHDETGDQYLAGLWRGQIEEQLCWRRWRSQETVQRPPWRAPTWSWASIDGRVIWNHTQKGILETKYAHVVDASTTPYGRDPFGQVTDAMIRLACSAIVSGHLIHSTKSSNPEAENGTTMQVHVGEYDFNIQIDCLDDLHEESNPHICLVPILGGRTGSATKRKDDEEYTQELMIEGIALRPTITTRGEFTRIGCFNFYKGRSRFGKEKQDEEEAYEPFLEVMEEQGKRTAEILCAEVIPSDENLDRRYVITII